MGKNDGAIRQELTGAEGHAFERAVLPFFKFLWPGAYIPESRHSTFDRHGVDIVSHSETDPTLLYATIQCKGFRVTESEIGPRQIEDCLASIEKFRSLAIKTPYYVLIHNRVPKNPDFRKLVGNAVAALVADGLADQAEVWDCPMLFRRVGDRIGDRFVESCSTLPDEIADSFAEIPGCEPIDKVPIQVSSLVFGLNAVISDESPKCSVDDPAKAILASSKENLVLLLANAGYGKTLTALRAVNQTKYKVIYRHAAAIEPGVNNTALLVKFLYDFDRLWDGLEPREIEKLYGFAAPRIEGMLQRGDTPVVVVIDALDESVYFNRTAGIQHLLNQVRGFKVPVVLIAREEYWEDRKDDFMTPHGERSQRPERKHRYRSRVVRLLDWTSEEILLLASRYASTLSGDGRNRVDEFSKLVKSGEYEKYYGDIPKRPLFLKYILESVAVSGVKETKRARLFFDWACMKIRRDVLEPSRDGSIGRPLPSGGNRGVSDVLESSLVAMRAAASLMCRAESGSLVLLPECKRHELLTRPELVGRVDDIAGLFLCSLLQPRQKRAGESIIAFGHRTYQEFFLAWHISLNHNDFDGLELPDGVRHQLEDIECEGNLSF